LTPGGYEPSSHLPLYDILIAKGGEGFAKLDMIVDGIVVEETYYQSVTALAGNETLDDGDVEGIIFWIKCDFEWDPNSMI
jgi:hypothetical protein